MGAGFGPIAVGIAIEVAMLFPHVLSTPLATASLALSEAKSQERALLAAPAGRSGTGARACGDANPTMQTRNTHVQLLRLNHVKTTTIP